MEIKINTNADERTLVLEGRLDTVAATELESKIQPLIDNPGSKVTVDISAMSYISSSGLRCFVRLFKACQAAGAEMAITGMQPAIREIFDMTGFSKIFGL